MYARVCTYRRGLQCCLFGTEGDARASISGTATVQVPLFYVYTQCKLQLQIILIGMNHLESKVAIEGTPAILELIAQTSKYVNLLEKQLTELKQEQLVKIAVSNSFDAETLLDKLRNQEPQPIDNYIKRWEITISDMSDKKEMLRNEINALNQKIDECINSIKELKKLITDLNNKNNIFQS